MTYETAVELLKKYVKDSHLDNQKHIDVTLAPAEIRPEVIKAMTTVQSCVLRKEKTQDEVNKAVATASNVLIWKNYTRTSPHSADTVANKAVT